MGPGGCQAAMVHFGLQTLPKPFPGNLNRQESDLLAESSLFLHWLDLALGGHDGLMTSQHNQPLMSREDILTGGGR